jgi:hypothetical protein
VRLVVLWEDKLTKGTRPVQYGPHQFLAAAVTDRLVPEATDRAWYETSGRVNSAIKSIACGGIDKLRLQIAEDRLYAGGCFVLAIYDDDEIRRHLGLDQDRRRTSSSSVIAELERSAGSGRRFAARPIGPDLESVIAKLVPADERLDIDRKASGGRAHRQRDAVLQQYASFKARESRAALANDSTEWSAIVDLALAATRPLSSG